MSKTGSVSGALSASTRAERASTGYLVTNAARASAYYLRDAARGWPVARQLGDIPTSPRELSAEWLTAALCADVPGAAVDDFEVPYAHNGTTGRFALRVGYNRIGHDAGLQAHLFAKSTRTFRQRIFLGFAKMLSGETTFLTKLRPHLNIEAPLGYYGAGDTRSYRSICLMEDVSETKGAQFLRPVEPVGRADIEDLIADLATMHGRFWESPMVRENGLRDQFAIVSWSDSLLSLRGRSHVGVKRAASVIPNAILDRTDEIFDGVIRCLLLDRDKPQTLLHGDPHAGQLYRTREGRIGLVDWQAVMRGSWVHDFSYAVCTSLGVEHRRAWDRDLLELYLERLDEAGGEPPSLADAWLEYRQHAFYNYIGWVFTMGRAAYQPEYQPDEYSLAIIERTANAIVDLDSFSALPR